MPGLEAPIKRPSDCESGRHDPESERDAAGARRESPVENDVADESDECSEDPEHLERRRLRGTADYIESFPGSTKDLVPGPTSSWGESMNQIDRRETPSVLLPRKTLCPTTASAVRPRTRGTTRRMRSSWSPTGRTTGSPARRTGTNSLHPHSYEEFHDAPVRSATDLLC
jgi:hypothetical protein